MRSSIAQLFAQAHKAVESSVHFYTPTNKAGFTMLEVLIVVTVLLLILGGGITSYLTFNDRQIVINDAKKLQTLIRSAQTKARVGDRPVGCGTLQSYQVRMADSSNVVEIVALCDDNEEIIRQTENLSPTVIAENAFEVTYFVLHGGADADTTVSLTSDQGRSYQFNVTMGGEVSVGELYEAGEAPSPSPIASPGASTQPSPSVSPSPSSSQNSLVVLSDASDLTCTMACQEAGYSGCWSVGTDIDGSNGKMYATYGRGDFSVCYQSAATCSTYLTNRDTTCSGVPAQWTYCHCYNVLK